MNKVYLLPVLLVILVLLVIVPLLPLPLFKLNLKQNFDLSLKQNFDKKLFLDTINKYNRVIVCGNSPSFNDSFKKIKNPNDAFIIRFNSVLDHLPDNSKTDVLFISKDVYDNYDKTKLNKWNNKTKVYLVDDLLLGDQKLFMNYPMNLTSGLSVLIFLVNYIDPKKIKVVGFDMVKSHNESSNWYGNQVLWNGHDIDTEKRLLYEIITKNNIIKY